MSVGRASGGRAPGGGAGRRRPRRSSGERAAPPGDSGQEREQLREGLQHIGLPAEEARVEALLAYIGELRRWNRRLALVADAGAGLIPRHLLDSLAPLPLLRELGGLEQAADVGAGNGFPSLPLLLCEERMQLSVIERSGGKAGFLRNAAAVTGVAGRARILEEDAERLAARGERFSLVISRAFLPFGRAFPLLEGLRKVPGGHLLYYGGRREALEGELARLRPQERRRCELRPVEVPFLDEERHLVICGD